MPQLLASIPPSSSDLNGLDLLLDISLVVFSSFLTTEKAIEIIDDWRYTGVKHVSFEPGSINAIWQGIKIATVNSNSLDLHRAGDIVFALALSNMNYKVCLSLIPLGQW